MTCCLSIVRLTNFAFKSFFKGSKSTPQIISPLTRARTSSISPGTHGEVYNLAVVFPPFNMKHLHKFRAISRSLQREFERNCRPMHKLTSDSKPREQDVRIDLENKIIHLNLGRTTGASADRIIDGGQTFHTTWLRHQCRCSSCFNSATFQTNVKITPKLLNATLKNAELTRTNLHLLWDDDHQTEFSLDWLQERRDYFTEQSWPNALSQIQHLFKPASLSVPDFRGEFMQNAINFSELIANDKVLAHLLRNIVVHGYGVVQNTPVDIAATEAAVERVTHIQRTMFGSKSCVINSAQSLEHKDTAYTSESLDSHSDNTYFSEPMGLEVFHCLHHDGEGGQSSFTDAFHAAQLLFQHHPEFYKTLSTTPVLFEYFDTGKQHYSCMDTIFAHDKFNGMMERVKFNVADMRTPIHIPLGLISKFYESVHEFSNILNSTTKWLKLSPGTIIFFDNWRMLHGRSAFTGNRKFATIYLGRSDWLSKTKLLGII